LEAEHAREEDGRRLQQAVRRLEPSLESFLPSSRGTLTLSASDMETYATCPLKYKFSRVMRIPTPRTINMRFGIVIHEVLESFHRYAPDQPETPAEAHERLLRLYKTAWRRGGFTDADDDRQYYMRGLKALELYGKRLATEEGRPKLFEEQFSFRVDDATVRGRIDRIDELPDGSWELIDYKTGKSKGESGLKEDLQLSLYQLAAAEKWGIEDARGAYWYVLDDKKVPVSQSAETLGSVRARVAEVAKGIREQQFDPTPSFQTCKYCDFRDLCPAVEK